MNHGLALITAKLALGATMALGIAVSNATGHAYADTSRCYTADWIQIECPDDDAYAREVGDDNADGTITEDESGWCPETMGNGARGATAFVFEGCEA